MKTVDEVLLKIAEARRKYRDNLKGVERMHFNLHLRLLRWMRYNDSIRCVTVGEIVEKVLKYAPKTISKSRDEVAKAVENLWGSTHDYSIDSEDYLQEDFEDTLNFYFSEKNTCK